MAFDVVTYALAKKYADKKVTETIESAYKFVGSVETYEELLTKNAKNGEVYNVLEDNMNYAWSDKENRWDALGVNQDATNDKKGLIKLTNNTFTNTAFGGKTNFQIDGKGHAIEDFMSGVFSGEIIEDSKKEIINTADGMIWTADNLQVYSSLDGSFNRGIPEMSLSDTYYAAQTLYPSDIELKKGKYYKIKFTYRGSAHPAYPNDSADSRKIKILVQSDGNKTGGNWTVYNQEQDFTIKKGITDTFETGFYVNDVANPCLVGFMCGHIEGEPAERPMLFSCYSFYLEEYDVEEINSVKDYVDTSINKTVDNLKNTTTIDAGLVTLAAVGHVTEATAENEKDPRVINGFTLKTWINDVWWNSVRTGPITLTNNTYLQGETWIGSWGKGVHFMGNNTFEGVATLTQGATIHRGLTLYGQLNVQDSNIEAAKNISADSLNLNKGNRNIFLGTGSSPYGSEATENIVVGGVFNSIYRGSHNLILGQQNAFNSTQGGSVSTNNILVGKMNGIYNNTGIVIGDSNIITSSGDGSEKVYLFGDSNNIKSFGNRNLFIIGNNNEISNNKTITNIFSKGNNNALNNSNINLFGTSLISSKDNQTIFGTFNEESTDSYFIIADGTEDDKRHNIVEVKSDGIYTKGDLQITKIIDNSVSEIYLRIDKNGISGENIELSKDNYVVFTTLDKDDYSIKYEIVEKHGQYPSYVTLYTREYGEYGSAVGAGGYYKSLYIDSSPIGAFDNHKHGTQTSEYTSPYRRCTYQKFGITTGYAEWGEGSYIILKVSNFKNEKYDYVPKSLSNDYYTKEEIDLMFDNIGLEELLNGVIYGDNAIIDIMSAEYEDDVDELI